MAIRIFQTRPRWSPKCYRTRGYDCGLIGKLHLSSAYRRIEKRVDDGYRYWQYSHAPRDDWETGHDYADWVRSKGEVLGELIKSPDGVPAELHQTTWCAEKTIEFMREQRDGPWLACVNIYDPHPPFNPPKAYRDRFDPQAVNGPLFRESDLAQQAKLEAIDFQSKGRHPDAIEPHSPGKNPRAERGRDAQTLIAAYYAMIALIDEQIGRVIAALEDTGQRDNTLVIFTSDHGEMLGDHGLLKKGCRFYEGLVRVPLIFSWPGHVQSGRRSDALVELRDIAPLLLELAGRAVPARMQPRSLLPMLSGACPADEHREFVRCEYYDALDQADGTYATMYRNRQYKLVVYHGHGLGELYDLAADPGEFDNLWDDAEYVDVKLDLMQRSFDASMLAMDKGPKRIGPM